MIRMGIEGIGVVGGFGCGVQDLARALETGPPAPGTALFPSGGEERRLSVFVADPAPLERFVAKRALRRIDRFSRLALLGAHLALEDAGLSEKRPDRLGVILVTGYGPTTTTFAFLDSVMDHGDPCASPTLFSNSVHNAAAAHVAIQLQVDGPSLTVSQFEMSVASGLVSARTWISEGRVDRVLFGAVEEYGPVVGYCWDRFFGEPAGSEIEPFDLRRQTAVAGEGAAFFVLGRNEEAARHGFITDVHLGRAPKGRTVETSAGFFALGLDGHRLCGNHYVGLLPEEARVAALSPYYGSLPIGPAFDLAIAALAAGNGRLPGAAFKVPPPRGWKPAEAGLLSGPICCLKADAQGQIGAITMTTRESRP